jgi:hypothetical protein
VFSCVLRFPKKTFYKYQLSLSVRERVAWNRHAAQLGRVPIDDPLKLGMAIPLAIRELKPLAARCPLRTGDSVITLEGSDPAT